MNNLIVEPRNVPRGRVLRGPASAAPQIWNFIPTVEFHSSSKVRTANRNYSQPYVPMFAGLSCTFMRYAYQPPLVAADHHHHHRQNFHFCKLFCHFLSSAIVSDGPHCSVSQEHNELFHSDVSCARTPALLFFFPVLSRGRCRFI